MDWITDYIAIGNFVDAERPDPTIGHILCLKPDCCKGRTDVDVTCIPIVDGAGNNPYSYRRAVDDIKQWASAKKKVLVHCHAGKSRSVVVVARYLMETRDISRDEAIEIIARKREIYLSEGIEEAFRGI